MRRRSSDEWDGQLSLFEDNASREAPRGRDVLVFDLETQRSFQDVGGHGATRELGMSIGVVYSFGDDRFRSFVEAEAGQLIDLLLGAELVVGYNLLAFDYEVLNGYRQTDWTQVKTLDLMVDLQRKLGFRPKLDSVVQATLGAPKSADGLQALAWWKEGRLDLIEKYCTDDVRLTRDLYLYGKRNRHVLVTSRSGAKPLKVDVSW
ncbi:MAG TPA: ribonuclease H-like domain-containing protein [Thermoanaerobaculaceae bacterium]|nr:ribonuclease H-like domain-containing protein [Thermoanaerobaculaceae bacterium]HRS16480.1 ribonuclease H-like domain-containing protein [Thermoanaerobaculaceae bacterium]